MDLGERYMYATQYQVHVPGTSVRYSRTQVIAATHPTTMTLGAKLAIIWMHGLGDRGSSWRGHQYDFVVPGVEIKWSFPDAPVIIQTHITVEFELWIAESAKNTQVAPVTCNGGCRMTSWFDLEVHDQPEFSLLVPCCHLTACWNARRYRSMRTRKTTPKMCR